MKERGENGIKKARRGGRRPAGWHAAAAAGLLAALVFIAGGVSARADFGDSNDYDYGGYDSYGDYGSDFDYGGNYDNGYDYGGYGSGGGYSSGSGRSYSLPTVILMVAALLLLVYYKNYYMRRKNSRKAVSRQPVYRPSPAAAKAPQNRTLQIEGLVRRTDPGFAAADFTAYAKNVFLEMQTAWMERDLGRIRPLLHENLYAQTQKQVDAKIAQGLINKLERIAVHEAYLVCCRRDEAYEYLVLYLHAKMADYQIDEKTGNIVSGDRSTLWDLHYRMKFMRTAGSVTEGPQEETEANECPHCGAPLEDGAANVCSYCGSVIRSERQDWVLCDFGSVKNGFPEEGVSWQAPEGERVQRQ